MGSGGAEKLRGGRYCGLTGDASTGAGGGVITTLFWLGRRASAKGAETTKTKLPMTRAERSRVIFMAVIRVISEVHGARNFCRFFATFL